MDILVFYIDSAILLDVYTCLNLHFIIISINNK
jgi:hypothetical protein